MRAAGPAFASTGESVSGKCLPSTIWDCSRTTGLARRRKAGDRCTARREERRAKRRLVISSAMREASSARPTVVSSGISIRRRPESRRFGDSGGSFRPLPMRQSWPKFTVVPRGEERRRSAPRRTASEPMCSPGGVTPGVVRGARPVALVSGGARPRADSTREACKRNAQRSRAPSVSQSVVVKYLLTTYYYRAPREVVRWSVECEACSRRAAAPALGRSACSACCPRHGPSASASLPLHPLLASV